MKRTFVLFAFIAISSLAVVSCRNANSNEQPSEDVQDQRLVLEENVLSVIDNLAAEYQQAWYRGDFALNLVLSDEEKLVKPDYLLETGLAPTFLTKRHKTAALAYYLVDYLVKTAYEMPLGESREVISKLSADINYPIDMDNLQYDITAPESNGIIDAYNTLKARDELDLFWKFQFAFLKEVEYLFTMNPELYLSKLNDEQLQATTDYWNYFADALNILAEYDQEIAMMVEISNPDGLSNEDFESSFETRAATLQTYKEDRFNELEQRNALLKY